MTKGNWERRAERASIEREKARERKINKRIMKIQSIEVIITSLLENKYQTRNEIIKVWIEDVTLFNSYCSNWLRSGDCNKKKCPLLHEYTFFGIRNIQRRNEENNESYNEPIIEMKMLSELKSEKYSLVRFIAINNVCIYDWYFSNIWIEWSTRRNQEIQSRKSLKSIHEGDDDNDGGEKEEDDEKEESEIQTNEPNISLLSESLSNMDLKNDSNESDSNNNNNNNNNNDSNNSNHNDNLYSNNSRSSFPTTTTINSDQQLPNLFLHLSQLLLSNIFQYCSLFDICSLNITSHSFRNIIRKDVQIRLRKKEFIDIHSKEINKKKKDEKKKKTKNSHLKKQDKKDGFARGGNC